MKTIRKQWNTDIEVYKCQSAIMGFVVGDALGVPVEFTSRAEREADPVTNMRAYGTHNQPAGTWSDDSSMVIATMEWYNEKKHCPPDYYSLMDKFFSWRMYGKYTPYDHTFDIGITVQSALMNYYHGISPLNCGETGVFSNGNGSLMRILPTALYDAAEYAFDTIHRPERIYEISALTHGHARSKLACLIYTKIVADMMYSQDGNKQEIVRESLKRISSYIQNEETDENIQSEYFTYSRLWDMDLFLKLSKDEIKSSGYVVNTLEAAVWCFLTTESYKDCVLTAVNLGEDTDTVGAIAGGLAGLYYGLSHIPEEWMHLIPKKEWILNLSREVVTK